MPCYLCGYDNATEELEACRWCIDTEAALSASEIEMMKALASINARFSIWDRRRRNQFGTVIKLKNPPVPQPAKICSSIELYVGDMDDVADIERLQFLNIKSVLTLCPECLTGVYMDVPARLCSAGIVQMCFPAVDSKDFDIVRKVIRAGAANFIDNRLRYGGVLVHCWGGVNRSTAVAVAYVMKATQMSLTTVVNDAMNTRGTVLTNYLFRILLVKYAAASYNWHHDTVQTSNRRKRKDIYGQWNHY